MTLPLEAMKWLVNERKRQQQEDDKLKKSSNLSSKDINKYKYLGQSGSNSSSSLNMPNQYAKVKNAVKGRMTSKIRQQTLMPSLMSFLKMQLKAPTYMKNKMLTMKREIMSIISIQVSVSIILCITSV